MAKSYLENTQIGPGGIPPKPTSILGNGAVGPLAPVATPPRTTPPAIAPVVPPVVPPITTPVATPPVTTPVTTPPPTLPTFNAAGYSVDAEDPIAKGARDFAASEASKEFNPDKIKADSIASYQAEVDALKGVYAQKLSEAHTQGLNRLGQAGVSQSRTGLIGSASQGQQNQEIGSNNTAIENSITDELNAKVSAVYSKANSEATTAIEAARKAKIEGGDKYLASITQRDTNKASSLKKLAATFINGDVDPSQLSPDQLKTLADSFSKAGFTVTADDIKNTYKSEKTADDTAKAKAKKDSQTTLSEGQVVVGPDGKVVAKGATKPVTLSEGEAYYDPTTGKVIYKNPKTASAGEGGTGGLTTDAWVEALNTGQATLANVPSAMRGAVLTALQAKGGTILGQASREKINAFNSAKAVINKLEESLTGVAEPLGGLTRATGLSAARRGVQQLFQTKEGQQETAFNAARDGFLATLSRAAGEKGVLTEGDVARIKSALPNLGDKASVRATKFQNVKDIFAQIEQGAKTSITAPSEDILQNNTVGPETAAGEQSYQVGNVKYVVGEDGLYYPAE